MRIYQVVTPFPNSMHRNSIIGPMSVTSSAAQKGNQEVACLAVAHPDASLLLLDPLRYATTGNSEPGHPLFKVLYLEGLRR